MLSHTLGGASLCFLFVECALALVICLENWLSDPKDF